MNADLERLIRLQQLDLAADAARKRIADEPARSSELDARLDVARQAVADAKSRVAANQAERREIEKEVAVHQGRLSKFREQAMAVKTNQEYHAVQHEIGFAQAGVKQLEDQILERMLEADELAADLKTAEVALASEQKAVDEERRALAASIVEMNAAIDRIAAERGTLAAAIDAKILATFELIATKRQGVALAEARDGHCTVCHVRLRPQIYNSVRRNDEIIPCDSCQRILYFAPAADKVGQPAQ